MAAVGAAIAACMTLASCGGAASSTKPAQPATPAANEGLPTMYLITLSDSGNQSYGDFDVAKGHSLMYMVLNEGTSPHTFALQAPLKSVQVDSPASGAAPSVVSPASQASVVVPAQGQQDVTLIPTTHGTFSVTVDGHAYGKLVVS